MILYHGTDLRSAKDISNSQIVNVYKSKKSVDFGPDFYMTENKQSAINWAKKKATFRKSIPAILTIEFDLESADQYIEKFQDDMRWGRFVINNRNGQEYIDHMPFKENNLDRRYHITYGRIADIDVVTVAEQLMESKESLRCLESILNPGYPMQYALHTNFSTRFAHVLYYGQC